MADHDNPGRRDGHGADVPPLRIGDAERQGMIDALQQHMSAGRLDVPEYERRVEHATAAIFARDLEGLLDDLPPLADGPRDQRHGDDGHGTRRTRPRRSAPSDRGGEPSDGPDWWPLMGGRGHGRPAWGRGGPVVAGPLLLLGAIALVVVTHGWILFPLLFLFFVKGGGGMCGSRVRGGHGRSHRGHDGHRGHGSDARGWHDPDHHRHSPLHGWGEEDGVWDEPVADRPAWPGSYRPERDDRTV